ncbi:unnamed protein product [Pleuronectes platessa]|uniref:Tc1-like transposase DDE domain-containing protein n=1 Tax=Pleuronectes platessa TaxID=8262 RepID=A0A9N7Z2U5_PLEPL|nr:unnamed protein product [Pleuronectes platessa]
MRSRPTLVCVVIDSTPIGRPNWREFREEEEKKNIADQTGPHWVNGPPGRCPVCQMASPPLLGLKNVNVLKWPSQSPDLNPIENIWQDLKIAVHRRSPSNLTELHLFCQEEWTNLSISRCAKLVETYPKRLAAVIAAKGGSTKY